MDLIAVRIAVKIEPALVVQPDGVHDERVAIPLAGGISHPGAGEVLRMAAPVGPDLAPLVFALKKHESPLGRLKNFKGLGEKQNARNSRGIALENRIVSAGLRLGAVPGLGRVVARLRSEERRV